MPEELFTLNIWFILDYHSIIIRTLQIELYTSPTYSKVSASISLISAHIIKSGPVWFN